MKYTLEDIQYAFDQYNLLIGVDSTEWEWFKKTLEEHSD